jgi:hypothetical protein
LTERDCSPRRVRTSVDRKICIRFSVFCELQT